MSELAIEHYTAERIPNPYPAGDLPWQVYFTVRNAVVRCCRRFGPTGPLGERTIRSGDEPPLRDWEAGDADPIDYFVVDDQLNHERYVYVEIVRAGAFTEQWLLDLVHTLGEHPGWGVGIMAFPRAYILAFADKLMVIGDIFATCDDLAGVVRAGQSDLANPSPGGGAR